MVFVNSCLPRAAEAGDGQRSAYRNWRRVGRSRRISTAWISGAAFSGCALDCSLVKRMPRYRVDIRDKELRQLGTVDAPNEWEALAKAVDLFDIRPALRGKTVVTKVEEPEPSSVR